MIIKYPYIWNWSIVCNWHDVLIGNSLRMPGLCLYINKSWVNNKLRNSVLYSQALSKHAGTMVFNRSVWGSGGMWCWLLDTITLPPHITIETFRFVCIRNRTWKLCGIGKCKWNVTTQELKRDENRTGEYYRNTSKLPLF